MSKINKIMLAAPNNRWSGLRVWQDFPYTLGMLTAVLKDRYDVRILDANNNNLSVDEVKNRVGEYAPDIFGVSCMSMEYALDYKTMTSCAKSASPETKVIVGGIFPTVLPEVVMKDENIDYMILGEGEHRFPKLLEYLENKKPLDEIDGLAYRNNGRIVVQEIKDYIQNLDSLPLPNYDNLDFYAYANKGNRYVPSLFPSKFPHAQTITSRGCAFKCVFCSSQTIHGPKIRYRSAESVLEETDWLVDKYKIKELVFLDDNFYLNRKRTKKTLEGLIKRGYELKWKSINAAVYALDDEILELMKESGCYQIILAIESGTQEGQKRLKKPGNILPKVKPVIKKAKSLGFEIETMYVIGTPGETWDQIRQTIKFADELDAEFNLDYLSLNIATPLPKTELYQISKERGLLPEGFSFDKLIRGFEYAVITTEEFTPKELEILRAYEWDRINFRTEEKREKVAKLSGITLEELNDWRIRTRRGVRI